MIMIWIKKWLQIFISFKWLLPKLKRPLECLSMSISMKRICKSAKKCWKMLTSKVEEASPLLLKKNCNCISTPGKGISI